MAIVCILVGVVIKIKCTVMQRASMIKYYMIFTLRVHVIKNKIEELVANRFKQINARAHWGSNFTVRGERTGKTTVTGEHNLENKLAWISVKK